jgi:predicted helicase
LRYQRVPEFWRKEEKLASLDQQHTWQILSRAAGEAWLLPAHADEFARFRSLADIFKMRTIGIKTNRDDTVYDFSRASLISRIAQLVEDYNAEVDRYRRTGGTQNIDEWVRCDRIKWSGSLKINLRRGVYAKFDESSVRASLYRSFSKRFLYFDPLLNERQYGNRQVFPTPATNNRVVCCTTDTQMTFSAVMTDLIPSHAPGGRPGQCFPFYTYSPDGSNRRENITDGALEKVRLHYQNPAITKWDIFHYIYAVLHHPAYREKFADNLKRELPRIPFAPDFAAFAAAGRELARLHVEYETLEPWPLEWVENPAEPLSYRVEDKMRLNKDKTGLAVNPSLTLAGIPPETFEYRLGNRSALEWVVDQYRVTEDERSGIKSDPNREDDPQYIVRLVGQVVRVSIETARIVHSLPAVFPG